METLLVSLTSPVYKLYGVRFGSILMLINSVHRQQSEKFFKTPFLHIIFIQLKFYIQFYIFTHYIYTLKIIYTILLFYTLYLYNNIYTLIFIYNYTFLCNYILFLKNFIQLIDSCLLKISLPVQQHDLNL